MSKHPLDRERSASGARVTRFTDTERAEQPSAATRALQQRARTQGEGKLRAFSRIEKDRAQG